MCTIQFPFLYARRKSQHEALCFGPVRPSVGVSVHPSGRPSVSPSAIACECDSLKTNCLIDFTF